MLWGILPTKARLNRIIPTKHASPSCLHCGVAGHRLEEDLEHALITSEGNQGLPALLLQLLRTHSPGISHEQLLSLDLNVDKSMELPLTWIISNMFSLIWQQRREGIVRRAKTRAKLEARCSLLQEGKVRALANAFPLTEEKLADMFRIT